MSTGQPLSETQRTQKHQQLREKYFQESKLNCTKPAYGLFSFPGTLAISRTGHDSHRPTRRNPDGSVMTAPRNFTAAPRRRGKCADAYFSSPSYITVGDPYVDPERPHRREALSAKKTHQVHESAFRAAGRTQSMMTIEYLPQGERPRPTRRDASGAVVTAPRNFYTTPAKKGRVQSTIGPDLGYVPDPYGVPKEKTRSSFHDQPFRGMCCGGRTFAGVPETYGGSTGPVRSLANELTAESKGCEHDRPFLPSSHMKTSKHLDSFAGVLEHIPDPSPPIVRKPVEEKIAFRWAGRGSSQPTPSVLLQNARMEARRG